ncbi:MAG TPA: 2,3-bisphosphoglycerate-independent phosphoglycerate mutase [Candidatus Binataceae bacterium]|nr:2,3-bisphosphoglycerate-independent phosphoglycerate mutase [Candidatus Binataceae bacterium]
MARPPIAALIIFDGWGIRAARESNAIAMARTPTMDRLYQTAAHSEVDASGESVGLPPGIMGNSEVGHLTIGAGRVIYQDVMRITKAIEKSDFSRNPELLNAIRNSAGHTLHLWGLLSDGSVHSHIDHLLALIDLAAKNGAGDINVHAVLDGRDKPPRSALPFIERVEAKLKEIGRGRIATVNGRYFAMDRDKRWDRVERAWRNIVEGDAPVVDRARLAVEKSYAADKSDEFVEPVSIAKPSRVEDGDRIICYNFRADRARELTNALALESFSGFVRPRFPKIGYVCMTEYDHSFGLPIAFGPEDIHNTLAEVFAREKIRNIRIAETEKYAHVTYFLNGGVEKPFPYEERALIPSAKVATYDLEPTMRAKEIAERAAKEAASGNVDVIVINFANPDMVGHTGVLDATVTAVEATDVALGIVLDAIAKRGGVALITADHGNAEFMADPATGQAHTAHTTFPVPLILVDPFYEGRLANGALYDVAPTFLGILGIAKPAEMTGHDLRIAK